MPQTHTHEHTRLTRYLHIHVLHAKVSHVSQLHVPTRWWLEAHSFVSWPARCKDGSLSLVCCFSHLDFSAKTPLFTVFRAFHVFLKLQKHCEYQHFLRSTRQKCCNLQCFFAWLSKTLAFAVFCASLVQKVLVFTAFSAFLHGSRQRR